MSLALGCAALAAIAVALAAAAGFGIRAMRRGSRHGTSGSLGAAVTSIHADLLDSSRKHVVEAMNAEREDERDVSGEPPE